MIGVLCVPPDRLRAQEALGLGPAIDEVRIALEDMAGALNALPARAQIMVSADLHLMSQAITRALDRLEGQPVPILDPTLVYDLNLLADIARAATRELRLIGQQGIGALDGARAARIDRLADAVQSRLIEIELVIASWTERNRNAVVEIQYQDGAIVVRSVDKFVYNAVRYTSIALLLAGLLAVGLQLLRMSEERVGLFRLLRETPVLSSLAIGALTLFFAGCVVFSVRPGTLAAFSAEVRTQPQEHPCERLEAQRDRLIAAQDVGHLMLIEATKQRMYAAAQDCLGLPTQTATAIAVDQLVAKTAAQRGQAPLASSVALAPPVSGDSVAAPASDRPPDTVAAAPVPERSDAAPPAAVTPEAEPAAPTPPVEPAAGPAPDRTPATEAEPATAAIAPEPEPLAEPEFPDQAAADADLVPVPALSPPSETPAEPRPEPELYITTAALNYRAAPSVDAPRLGTFVPGALLAVVDERDGWARVQLRDGREVFVASRFLEPAP